MVAKKSLDDQLDRIGLHFRIFGRGEIKELQRVLRPGENIFQCAFGFFNGSSGLLVATDQRLILIDKNPLYSNLEEFSYDVIDKIDFTGQSLQASLIIYSFNKSLQFKSLSDARLRKIANYTKSLIDLIATESMFGSISQNSTSNVTPRLYNNQVWHPRTKVLIPRLRPTKFYLSNSR